MSDLFNVAADLESAVTPVEEAVRALLFWKDKFEDDAQFAATSTQENDVLIGFSARNNALIYMSSLQLIMDALEKSVSELVKMNERLYERSKQDKKGSE